MIKPIEKANQRRLYFKFFLILSLLLLGIIFKPSVKKVEAPEVLGAKESKKDELNLNEIKKELENKMNDFFQTIKSTSEKTVETTTNTISQTASKSAQTVTNFIFDQAINNILKEVEKLPPQQQEKIKEKICQ
jgi:hypothetical protein